MPTLNRDILLEVLLKIIRNCPSHLDELEIEMYRFGLAGKENLKVLMEFYETARHCSIDADSFRARFKRSYVSFKPNSFFAASMIKRIGHNLKELSIIDEPNETKPLIDAVCEAKQLRKLDLKDSSGGTAFQRVSKECSKSLKKISMCVTEDIPQIGDAMNCPDLDELNIDADISINFSEFLSSKCCRTKSFVLQLYKYLPTSTFSWNNLNQSFSGIQNPALESAKEFLLFLKFDENEEDLQLTELIKNVSETFPSLETFNFVKHVPPNNPSDGNALDYYYEFYEQFIAASHKFKTNISWIVKHKCDESSLHTTKSCILSQSSKFTVIKEYEKEVILGSTEKISDLKQLKFQIQIVSVPPPPNAMQEAFIIQLLQFASQMFE